jgi:ferritin-like protein
MAVRKEANAFSRIAADPVSRRKFIALGGGSAAAAAFLAACGSDSGSTTTTVNSGGAGGVEPVIEEKFGKGDIGILNYALTLEYLETAFYADVVKSGLFKGSDQATIRKFGSEEAEHVAALIAFVKKLGGKPAPKPKTEFPLKSAKPVLELAGTVESRLRDPRLRLGERRDDRRGGPPPRGDREDGPRGRLGDAATGQRPPAPLRQGPAGLGAARQADRIGKDAVRPQPRRHGDRGDRRNAGRQRGSGDRGATRRQRLADLEADRQRGDSAVAG